MEFAFTPDEEAFRQEVRAFLKEELTGHDIERGGSPDRWQAYRDFIKKLADRGWLTLAWPKEAGGQGASHMMQLVYNEEMALHDAPATDLGSDRVGPTIMLYGTDEQKQRFLPPIVRGEAVWCQGFSEPSSGSDLASLEMRATQDGDDFLINGSKIWTSLAHFAEWIILLARTDPDAPKHKGISYFLVDMKTPGIEVRPLVDMLGRHQFNQVFFDNVRVPRDSLLGELNRGWYVATATLDFERSGIQRVIGSMRTYEQLVAYAHETMRNGRPLLAEPLIRHQLADLHVPALGRFVAHLDDRTDGLVAGDEGEREAGHHALVLFIVGAADAASIDAQQRRVRRERRYRQLTQLQAARSGLDDAARGGWQGHAVEFS